MKDFIIFDLDDTIIKGQSQKMLLTYLKKRGVISTYFFVRLMAWFVLYKAGIVKNPRPVMTYAYSFMQGRSTKEVSELLAPYIDAVIAQCVYKDILARIHAYAESGATLLIVTNSADALAKPLAERFGVPNVLCTELEVIDGVYTGKIIGYPVYGEEKVPRVETFALAHGLNLKEATFYSDHISDLPLFEAVKTRFVVNPHKKFAQIVSKRGWEILKPV